MSEQPVIVNNPQGKSTNNSVGFVVGALILLLVIIVFFIYGLPAIRSIGTTQVNIPDHMNVNVQQGGSKSY